MGTTTDEQAAAATSCRRYVDLSHELVDRMPAYPGLPSPRITAQLDHAESRAHYDGDEFFLGRVEMPTNVGTYVDAPFHRFPHGDDLTQVPLDRLAGLRGIAVDASREAARGLDLQLPAGDLSGAAVLVSTGWDARWGTEAYWEPGPYLTDGLAERLVDRGVGLVGVDCWNVDDTTTRRRPVHTRLLGAGILVVEHLRGLERLPERGFRFFAPVLRVRRGASFPVRAFAELQG